MPQETIPSKEEWINNIIKEKSQKLDNWILNCIKDRFILVSEEPKAIGGPLKYKLYTKYGKKPIGEITL